MQHHLMSEPSESPQWNGEEFPKLRMRDEKQPPLRIHISVAAPKLPEPVRAPIDSRWQRYGLILFCVALAAALTYGLVDRFVITSVVIPREGKAAERHHLYRWRYLWLSPQRGDTVVVKDHADLSIRTIVARPSDYLSLKNGVVYLNGKPQDGLTLTTESAETGDLNGRLLQLGRDQFYVTGSGGPGHGVVLRKDILGLVTD